MKLLITMLSVLLLLGACEFSASVGGGALDVDKVESEILSGIEEQTEADIDTVECPDEVELEEGNTFECTATDTQGTRPPCRSRRTTIRGT